MLTKLYKIILCVIMMFSAVGCSDRLDAPAPEIEPDSPGSITLRFFNNSMTRTVDSDKSENLIDNALVALYPLGAGDEVPAVVVRSFYSLEGNGIKTITMALSDGIVERLFHKETGYKCNAYVLVNAGKAIYDNLGLAPTISGIKNVGINSEFAIKAQQTSFVMTGEGEVQYSEPATPQEKGKASGTIQIVRAAAKVLLNIKLPKEIKITAGEEQETWTPITTDNALKVLLNNGVWKTIAAPLPDEEGNPWEPGGEDENSYYFNSKLNKPATVRILSHNDSKDPEDDYPYVMSVPFYTYPNAWKEDVSEEHKTTLTLMVPWKNKDSQEINTYYYQISVTPGGLSHIARNHAYIINLNVGMLGSLSPDEPLTVKNLSYLVVDWEDAGINLSIHDTRYLVVNPTTYELNNEAEISLPYYTSHPVVISDIKIEYERYNFYANGYGDKVTIPITKAQIDESYEGNDSICNYYLSNKRVGKNYVTHLTVNHPLTIWKPVALSGDTVSLTGNGEKTMTVDTNNEVLNGVLKEIVKYVKPKTPEPPYSAYTIFVTLTHQDNSSFSETVKIVQYPAMYIEAEKNPGGGVGAAGGNVFVNDNSAQGDADDWDAVSPNMTGDNTNKNPNMYTITISQLDSSSQDYVIGDPRMVYYTAYLTTNRQLLDSENGTDYYTYQQLTTRTSNYTNTTTWSEQATALYYTGNNRNRRLIYYYPTIEDEAYSMRIAPKIRIASSYGKTRNPLTRLEARRRAATYQERNYPAGRWRLPTKGELQYIVKLSQDKKIPVLFNEGDCYWTAQGSFKVNTDGTLEEGYQKFKTVGGGPGQGQGQGTTYRTSYVRPVYDEWYWDLYESKYQLTPDQTTYQYRLGDIPRSVAPTGSN